MNKILILMISIVVFFLIWQNYKDTNKMINLDKNISMVEVWEEYKTYWMKNEPDMTAPNTCKPDTKKDINELENYLKVKLPDDFKISLETVSHNGKKCDDNLYHSWFGSKTGVSLYNVSDIINSFQGKGAIINAPNFYIKNVYWNKTTPYHGNYWSKRWIPIMAKYNIIFFIDLRENIGSEYGQVLAFLETSEGVIKYTESMGSYTKNPNMSYNNFIFIAKDYKEFMQLMLEEIRANGELKDKYFTRLFHLPFYYFW